MLNMIRFTKKKFPKNKITQRIIFNFCLMSKLKAIKCFIQSKYHHQTRSFFYFHAQLAALVLSFF